MANADGPAAEAARTDGEPAGPAVTAGEQPTAVLAKALSYLTRPSGGTPPPLTSAVELARVVDGVARGSGPVAIDAERASGYRYSQRAYLVQLRRTGFGTAMIDPIALPDLSDLDGALADAEWIVHAATQDLGCLAELGMRPRSLFDTELAGRLLGYERVALGTMLEQYLGISLEKGHSAADWSTRPLPPDWLDYAALDVELLIELREVLVAELDRAGKLAWAEQEFQAILDAPPAPPRIDPWRRTSGIHAVRSPRRLAMLRALWQARDSLAAQRDLAPGRVLPDSAIMTAVKANPAQLADLTALPVFNGPRQRRLADYWFGALVSGRDLPESELPPLALLPAEPDAMPTTSRWRDRDPEAATRLADCKTAVGEVAEREQVLTQNLLAGDVVRRLAWRPVAPLTVEAVRKRLAELGARPWQIDLTAPVLVEALQSAGQTADAGADADAPADADVDVYVYVDVDVDVDAHANADVDVDADVAGVAEG